MPESNIRGSSYKEFCNFCFEYREWIEKEERRFTMTMKRKAIIAVMAVCMVIASMGTTFAATN